MSLPRYGRWLRVEKAEGGPCAINLDQVTDIIKGPYGNAAFCFTSRDRIVTNEPFEAALLRVMVDEADILPQPTPPISRDQLAMFPERAS